MPFLYTMKPIICNACDAKLEPNIIGRVGLWLFITVLFSFVFTQHYLNELMGKDAAGIVFLSFIGLFFLSIIVGLVMDIVKPWQFTLWNPRDRRRAFINYGAIISVVVYAIIFYSLKDSLPILSARSNLVVERDCANTPSRSPSPQRE